MPATAPCAIAKAVNGSIILIYPPKATTAIGVPENEPSATKTIELPKEPPINASIIPLISHPYS
jgi:hypothetical protein